MAKTILLVDDDIDLLRSVAEMLRRDGYSVFEHSDSSEALECIRRNQDLTCVLTDVEMPGMNGISLLAEIRRIRPIVGGLLMSGNFRWWGPESTENIECLRKPFRYDELLDALERCSSSANQWFTEPPESPVS